MWKDCFPTLTTGGLSNSLKTANMLKCRKKDWIVVLKETNLLNCGKIYRGFEYFKQLVIEFISQNVLRTFSFPKYELMLEHPGQNPKMRQEEDWQPRYLDMRSSAGLIAQPAFCPKVRIIPLTLRPMSRGPWLCFPQTIEVKAIKRKLLARKWSNIRLQ